MHIPDNYLSPSTCAVMGAAMVPVWALAVKHVKKEISREKLPLLGISAAFSFLVMMFNVPLPGGTTGHAVGGTLIAVLLGPWSAAIAVSVALLIQALLFGDGGILSFGANCFNMAFVLPFAGYYAYRLIAGKAWTADKVSGTATKAGRNRNYLGLILGSYIGINLAALCAAIEFGIQPALFHDAAGQPLYCPYPLSVSIPAMLIPHLLVAGLVEAVYTAAITVFLHKVEPASALDAGAADAGAVRTKPVFILMIIMILLTPLGLLATGTAWGEWGTDEISMVQNSGRPLGYVPTGMEQGFSFTALMPDYSLNGLPDFAGYIVSAVAGAALLVIIFKLLGPAGGTGSGSEKE